MTGRIVFLGNGVRCHRGWMQGGGGPTAQGVRRVLGRERLPKRVELHCALKGNRRDERWDRLNDPDYPGINVAA